MKLRQFMHWLSPRHHNTSLVKIRIKDAGDGELWTCSVEPLPAVIGRSSEADIKLTDPWVSHVHCCLTVVDDTVMVRDLESRNGTAVNKDLVSERRLHVGDTISIGLSVIDVLSIPDGDRLRMDL